jgi:methionyl-tRNA formyltransferase
MWAMEPRIVFMGTPEFAIPTLEHLVANYNVVGIVTQPDSLAGRGRQLVASPVKEMAVAEGIPVFQPKHLRNQEAVEFLQNWAPEVIVVAAFGQILRKPVLDIPRFGILNVHASLLPRWRGASPIQGALLAGDSITGVTIMKIDEGMDTGPILSSRQMEIYPNETAGELENRLAVLGAELLMETLPLYLAGKLLPIEQPEGGVTITRLRKKNAEIIDWAQPADVVHNHIRAYAPKPGAYTFWNGTRFKVLRSCVIQPGEVPEGVPGTVFLWEKKPVVITSDGYLALKQVQMAGKRPMDGGAFVHGRKNFVGTILGSP